MQSSFQCLTLPAVLWFTDHLDIEPVKHRCSGISTAIINNQDMGMELQYPFDHLTYRSGMIIEGNDD